VKGGPAVPTGRGRRDYLMGGGELRQGGEVGKKRGVRKESLPIKTGVKKGRGGDKSHPKPGRGMRFLAEKGRKCS